MTDDLVKRLRSYNRNIVGGDPFEAADRIKELEAENERLRAVVANMANTLNIVGSDYDQTIKALDRLVLSVKSQARAARAGKAEQ